MKRHLTLLVVSALVLSGPRAFAQGPLVIQILPKDSWLNHEYLNLQILPPSGRQHAHVVFQECHELSRPDETRPIPNCEIRGYPGGYDITEVGQEGSNDRVLFIARIAGETGALIASGLTGGTMGVLIGTATGVAGVSNTSGFNELRTRRSTQAIAHAADGNDKVVHSNRNTADLFEVEIRMIKDLEKKRRHQDKQRALDSDPKLSTSQSKPDSPESQENPTPHTPSAQGSPTSGVPR